MPAHETGARASRRTGRTNASQGRARAAFSPDVCPPAAEAPGRQALRLARWCVACLLACLAPVRPAQAAAPPRAALQSEATALVADTRLERTLAGGEAQHFRLRLDAGRYARVVVMQKGVDVAVALLDPAKRRLLEIDSPNGSSGPEPLSFVAEAAGEYLIEVRSPNKAAAAGRYEIGVEALRDPTPSDLARVRAERAFAEAFGLATRPDAVARREAVNRLEALLPVFRSLDDRAMEALTLNTVALGYHSSGELQKALRYYNEALPISRALGDRNGEARLLNNVGGAYDILGEPQTALDYYGRALALWRDLTNATAQGDTLNNIGVIYFNLGDLQRALDYYNQALPHRKAGSSRRREADTLGNVGLVYIALGERQQALEYLRQALRLRREAKDVQGEATTLYYLGYTYADAGDAAEARGFFNQSLPLRRTAGDRRGEATTLNGLGASYSSAGQPEKALELHRQALQLTRDVGDRREEAYTLGHIGRAHAVANRRGQAAESYRQAVSMFQALGDRRAEARARQDFARVERDGGDLAGAREQIEAAVTLIESMRAGVASPQLRTSFFASRQDAYEFYVDLLMRMHRLDPAAGHDAAAFQVGERARARQLLETLSEIKVDIRRGVPPSLLERERRVSGLLGAKTERLLRLQGQRAAEEAAALRQEIGRLEAEYQQVQGEVRRQSPHYASITQPLPLGTREIQRQLLDSGTLLLEYSLGTERSYLWAVTRDSLKSYELPGRADIERTARRLYGLVTARGVRRRGESARQRRQRINRADEELRSVAGELSRMTLAPAAAELRGRRLAIVPDGVLQYIPFSMLPAPDGASAAPSGYRPLVLDHEVVNLPSASALAVQRRELAGRAPAPYQVAVIADPVFESADARVTSRAGGVARAELARAEPGQEEESDTSRLLEHLNASAAGAQGVAGGQLTIPRLPYTRQEAERILEVASGGRNLRAVDFEAKRAAALGGGLRQYRYVHFATHGYVDAEKPGLSAVVLSLVDEKGRAQDGLLKASDIYNLQLHAELVVLSACQTGLGKEIRGEGLVGLTRGFMYAGAARVTVSLWSVSDRGTAELMWRLYRGMLREGRSPASALRAAQIEMWKQKRWQSPYYWAAFVQQGEWK